MSVQGTSEHTLKASDLRAILEYVPLYRNQTFVIAIDGSVVDDANFSNIVTDIAVLRSLNINIVIAHGIGKQLKEAGEAAKTKLSDIYGNDPIDDATFKLAHEASAKVLQKIRDAFSAQDLNCVTTNAIRAAEIGIISGVNYLNAGKIEKIDFDSLVKLLNLSMIPVLSPIATGKDGRLFRINSDLLASELAQGLNASKLIYLTVTKGLAIDSDKAVAIPADKLQVLIDKNVDRIDTRVLSKAKCALKLLNSSNTPRAHILDGRTFACLLDELFDKVGCGTMIYNDEYQKIRKANTNDALTIFNISRVSFKEQNLIERSLAEIEENIEKYFVYEIDGSIIAFVSLLDIGGKSAELASLHVQQFYQHHDVGTRMVEYVKIKAKEAGFKKLFALSTKSASFFTQAMGFVEVPADTLPKERFEKYENSKRNSKVLLFELK